MQNSIRSNSASIQTRHFSFIFILSSCNSVIIITFEFHFFLIISHFRIIFLLKTQFNVLNWWIKVLVDCFLFQLLIQHTKATLFSFHKKKNVPTDLSGFQFGHTLKLHVKNKIDDKQHVSIAIVIILLWSSKKYRFCYWCIQFAMKILFISLNKQISCSI